MYIESDLRKLLCLNANTGELAWMYNIDDTPNSAAVKDVYVYISSDYGIVTCLKAGEGDDGSWAMFRGNPARTGTYP